jgi:hypothetical protein
MDNKTEAITKFLGALRIDLIRDVKYNGRVEGPHRCVCGQPIQRGYHFINTQNHLECVVGKNCLNYIAWYLNWK